MCYGVGCSVFDVSNEGGSGYELMDVEKDSDPVLGSSISTCYADSRVFNVCSILRRFSRAWEFGIGLVVIWSLGVGTAGSRGMTMKKTDRKRRTDLYLHCLFPMP